MAYLPDRLDLDGCRLAYADAGGPGTPVLLLHGAGADHAMFTAQAEALRRRGHRAILVDIRGHGLSRPSARRVSAPLLLEDAESVVERLGLNRPVLVGHSLGGNIAQELVRRAPDRYRGLVVLCSTWNTGPLSAGERMLLTLAAPSLALVPARRLPGLLARASATTEAARTDATRAFSQLSKAEFLDVWRATTDFVRPHPMYRTPVPLALIRGAEDRTGNIARAMPRWAAHDGVTETVVPGAGHLVTQDAPSAVTDALTEFLEDLTGVTSSPQVP